MTEVTDEVIIPVRGVVTMMGNLWIVAGESNVPVAFVPKGAWNSNDITNGAAVPLQLMDPAHERTIPAPLPPQVPSVGRIVHYQSYGTPGGEYTSQCRAAVIAAVPTATWEGDAQPLDLVVLNPTGTFFNRCAYADPNTPARVGDPNCPDAELRHNAANRYCPCGWLAPDIARGGTWHWPERV